MKIKAAVESLFALAHDTRLAVFRRLVVAGKEGCAAGELSDALRIPPPTLSFHLKHLEQAGLVRSERQSRNIIYTANYEHMRALMGFLLQDCCGGRPEICAIDVKECCS